MNNTNFTTNEATLFERSVLVLFSLLMSVVKRTRMQTIFHADSACASSVYTDLRTSSQIAFKNSSFDEQCFPTQVHEKSAYDFASIDAMNSALKSTFSFASNFTFIRTASSPAVALKNVLNDVTTEMTDLVSSLMLVFTSLTSLVLNPRCTQNGKVVLTSNGNKIFINHSWILS